MKGKKYMSGGDVKKVKQIANSEVKKHEKNVHKMAKGGGIKIRGTGAATKGTMARGPMA